MGQKLCQTFREILSLDLRSLALMRVMAALVLLYDLADRGKFLKDHYTDWGMYPRWLLAQHGLSFRFSIFSMSGDVWVIQALFAATAMALLALLFGYRTKWATFVSWFLMFSLHNRNEIVNFSCDVVARLTLFWGMFLPWGAKYSVDAALDNSGEKIPTRVVSFGTVGYLIQFCFFYAMAGFLKTGEKWMDGTATYYALSLDTFARPIGVYVRENFKDMLKILTVCVLYFERYGWLLFFVPYKNGFFRLLGVLGFAGLQFGFGSFLHVGIFPWISTTFLLGILPSAFWGQAMRFFVSARRAGAHLYYDGAHPEYARAMRLFKTFFLLPETHVVRAQDIAGEQSGRWLKNHLWMVVDHRGEAHYGFDAARTALRASPVLAPIGRAMEWRPVSASLSAIYRWAAAWTIEVWRMSERLFVERPLRWRLSVIGSIAAIATTVVIAGWNIGTIPGQKNVLPQPVQKAAMMLGLDQFWTMFAPFPSTVDGWYVAPGILRDGSEVDVLRKTPGVSWVKPKYVSETFKTERWRKYYEHYAFDNNMESMRMDFGKYVCREWNESHPDNKDLLEYRIFVMREDELPGYKTSEPRKVEMWHHYCFDKPAAEIIGNKS